QLLEMMVVGVVVYLWESSGVVVDEEKSRNVCLAKEAAAKSPTAWGNKADTRALLVHGVQARMRGGPSELDQLIGYVSERR
ncbi:hypothetical protein OFB65_26855, partial [Escherichia coli]|nr:hypothetical protein [Escherichia coli]